MMKMQTRSVSFMRTSVGLGENFTTEGLPQEYARWLTGLRSRYFSQSDGGNWGAWLSQSAFLMRFEFPLDAAVDPQAEIERLYDATIRRMIGNQNPLELSPTTIPLLLISGMINRTRKVAQQNAVWLVDPRDLSDFRYALRQMSTAGTFDLLTYDEAAQDIRTLASCLTRSLSACRVRLGDEPVRLYSASFGTGAAIAELNRFVGLSQELSLAA